MAGLANPGLTLTRDVNAKTVRAVATCRILFNDVELEEMDQDLRFRFRATLFGADVLKEDDVLFTFMPSRFYPDATPGSIEEVRFEDTLLEDDLDESVILADRIYARFELTNLRTKERMHRDSPEVVDRF